MPIHLNLLAEAQAAEEERRRDPVKRVLWIAALIVVLILVWSSSLQLKAMLIRSEVSRVEAQITARTSEYRNVLDNQTRVADLRNRVAALQNLSTNRLLAGTLLNALQQTTVDDIQLLRLRVDQIYVSVEGTKTHTNEQNVVIAGRPPTTTEKILLTLEGADSSANPGDQVNKYKGALAANPYLKDCLVKTNGITLKNLTPPQMSPLTGKRSVTFTMECRFPDKTR
jgi:hypothetical protein